MSNLFYSGKYFGLNAFTTRIGPDFRVNDVGFLRGRIDYQQVVFGINAGRPDPWGIRNIRWFGNVGGTWNTKGLRLGTVFNNGANIEFRNFWRLNAFVGHQTEREDDLDTRGGPPILRPPVTFMTIFVNSDSRKTWRIGLALVQVPRGIRFPTRWCRRPQLSHNAPVNSRVHPKYKTRYRVGNWPAYERALVQHLLADIEAIPRCPTISHFKSLDPSQVFPLAPTPGSLMVREDLGESVISSVRAQL